MSELVWIAVFALFLGLLAYGSWGLVRGYRRRLAEWAEAEGVTIVRCEETGDLVSKRRPRWRIRVRTARGEIKDGWVQGGWSVREPVEATWAKPGESVFR